MRKLSRREQMLLGLVVVGFGVVGVRTLRNPEAGPLTPTPSRPEGPMPAVPRIDLARLDAKLPENDAGKRDLFNYGLAEPPETPVEIAPPQPTLPIDPTPVVPIAPPTPTLPPLNLKYIGSVENTAGIKVAVLLTDRREILTGQAGQVVANRYRISRIGLESVDLEDVSSGQSRRIPLRGN